MKNKDFELRYNLTGSDRKQLVTVMAEILNCPAKYKGAPSFGYEVDYFTIDKNGTIRFDDRADSEEIEKLIERLHEQGFEAESQNAPDDNAPEEAGDSLVISYPRKDISDAALENLRLLVASKESLIKKALGADALPIEVTDETVNFPWFAGFPSPEEIIGMAKTQKRVTAKEKDTDNEKYAFRCFLLRLGFIGDEYKAARKILLRNLTGSGAFKSGNPKTQEYIEKIEGDAGLYDDVMSLQDKEVADDELSK